MKMNNYINDFTNHLSEALSIGEKTLLTTTKKEINILPDRYSQFKSTYSPKCLGY